nr:hypothetical protein [Tanacetum cinerariifolium]
MMTDEFCPTEEVQRLEDELRHLKLRDINIAAYTERFNELAVLCPDAVPNEKKKVELYIKGLPEIIIGETTSSRPVTLNEAVHMAHALMEQKIQSNNERIAEGTFNVIVGMDWLVELDALIVCGRKEVHVPYRNKTLVVKSDCGVSRLKDTQRKRLVTISTSHLKTKLLLQEVEGFEPPQEEVVPIRRSARTHQAPDRLCLNVEVKEHGLGDLNKPTNYKATILDLESDKWVDAMNVEMQSIKDNQVWRLVDLPLNWLIMKKTFSPVADIRAIRILITTMTFYDYKIWKMDVKTSFLNEYLDEDIYMVQPKGFVDPDHPRKTTTPFEKKITSPSPLSDIRARVVPDPWKLYVYYGGPLSPSCVFNFPEDDLEPHLSYDFFAPAMLPGYAGNPNNNNGWLEVDDYLLGELEAMVDEQMVVPAIEEGFDEEEAWEVNGEWLMAPITPPMVPTGQPSSFYDVEGPSTAVVEGPSFLHLAPGLFVPPFVGAQVEQGQETTA